MRSSVIEEENPLKLEIRMKLDQIQYEAILYILEKTIKDEVKKEVKKAMKRAVST